MYLRSGLHLFIAVGLAVVGLLVFVAFARAVNPIAIPLTLSGRVYEDVNANRIFDAGDLPLANVAVRYGQTPLLETALTYTEPDGAYSVTVEQGKWWVGAWHDGHAIVSESPLLVDVTTPITSVLFAATSLQTVPFTMTGLFPTDGTVFPNEVSVTWASIPTATGYLVDVWQNDLPYQQAYVADSRADLIVPAGQYEWRVRGVLSETSVTAWSAWGAWTVAQTAEVPVFVTTVVSSPTPTSLPVATPPSVASDAVPTPIVIYVQPIVITATPHPDAVILGGGGGDVPPPPTPTLAPPPPPPPATTTPTATPDPLFDGLEFAPADDEAEPGVAGGQHP